MGAIMKAFSVIALAGLFSVTILAMNEDMESYARRREQGAIKSIKGHMLRAQTSNDQNARYSPQLEEQDGRGKPMHYLISRNGSDRQWVLDTEYERHFRDEGYIILADRVLP
jgi:hypothetical protein